MNRIHKYTLEERSYQQVELPEDGFLILHVALQNDIICFWAEVNPETKTHPYTFHIIATGDNVPPGLTHIETIAKGTFVWHIYLDEDRI